MLWGVNWKIGTKVEKELFYYKNQQNRFVADRERERVLVGPCPRIVGVMIIHIGRAGGAASSQTVWGSALERYDSVVSAAKRVKRAHMKRVFA